MQPKHTITETKVKSVTSLQRVDVMMFGLVLLSVVSILVLILGRISSGM